MHRRPRQDAYAVAIVLAIALAACSNKAPVPDAGTQDAGGLGDAQVTDATTDRAAPSDAGPNQSPGSPDAAGAGADSSNDATAGSVDASPADATPVDSSSDAPPSDGGSDWMSQCTRTSCPPGWTLQGSSCTTTMAPTTTLATGGTAFAGLALDTGNVYWYDSSAGTVNTVPKSGGTLRTLAQNQSPPVPTGDPWSALIVVDDAFVYWKDNATGAIMRTVKDGSGSPSIVVAATSIGGFGIIGDDIYWLHGYSIERSPKAGGGASTIVGDFGIDAGQNFENEVFALRSNGTFLLGLYGLDTMPYWIIVDPSSGSILEQVFPPGPPAVPVAAIDSTDFYYNEGIDCPAVGWTSLAEPDGGSVALYPKAPLGPCNAFDSAEIPSVVAGNRCAVFWSVDYVLGEATDAAFGLEQVSMSSKLPDSRYPVPLIPTPATSLAADDTALFVATATTITRVDLP